MAGTRIVAFLGRNQYVPRSYKLVGRGVCTTKPAGVPHEVWLRLGQLLHEGRTGVSAPDHCSSIVIVGTAKTREDFFVRKDLVRELRVHLAEAAHDVPIAFLQYDHSALTGDVERNGEKSFWDLFEGLRHVLSPNALSFANGGALSHMQGPVEPFQESADDVVVDVTHGYRATPFLAAAVLSFVLTEIRSESRRLFAAQPQNEAIGGRTVARDVRHHILYAAFEMVPEDGAIEVPVWDLTRFVLASRLADAVDALVCYGRADDLAAFGEEDAKIRKAPIPCDKRPKEVTAPLVIAHRFGRLAKTLADDLALIRLKDIFRSSAPEMWDFLNGPEATQLLQCFPPLRGTLNLLSGWVKPLVAPNVLGGEGLRATTYLAQLYEKLGQFAAQAVALREGLVTHFGLMSSIRPVEPGETGSGRTRRATDEAWSAACRGIRSSSDSADGDIVTLSPDLRVGNRTIQPRNDIQHGGLVDQPLRAPDLRQKLDTLTRDFADLVNQ